ncbi:hypothetical protein PSECIP111951_02912 [Pseudoalteromonas holothuriae]|uniref:Type I restriction modification DNA specificity domain-containing protein n=1 Tax=Pseudoalteromonas holothuriae TaxID=2963714 RepID=A0ABM9GKL7_9GAMM|nr:restriction endonuclease subunit S [Pseudoalteromonas sp. CIP111951]CAH9063483.1 hypothetical protein PSECIP111951_02912 [Pseudoalteromonas sp. CIP111951]
MSWPLVRISDICTKVTDGSHNPPKGIDKSDFLMLSSKNIFDDDINFDKPRYLSKENFQSEDKRTQVTIGDVLLTIVGTIGRAAVVNESHGQFVLQRSVAVLKPKPEMICPRFLMYTLQNMSSKLVRESRGVAQKGIYLKQIKELEIPLPPLYVQKQIAAVLEKANTLRGQCQQMEQELNTLAQSVFLDMFGDPAVNPKNWNVQPVKSFLEVTTGNTPSKANDDYYSSDFIEWAKSDNINTPSDYLTKASVYLSEEGKKVARTVSAGSILVTCIAGSPSCIGNAAITDREVAFNQQINAVTPIQGKSVSEYIYMSFIVGKQLIQRASTNSMKGMVSKGNFEKIEFPLPPVEFQEKYSEFFRELLDKRLLANQKFQSEHELFNSLMQKAFKGELELKDVA